jgi:hypothetical protein
VRARGSPSDAAGLPSAASHSVHQRGDGCHVAATSLVHENSVPSTQMRCMITANWRAKATIAFFSPRCVAIFIAQALSQDHFVERTIGSGSLRRALPASSRLRTVISRRRCSWFGGWFVNRSASCIAACWLSCGTMTYAHAHLETEVAQGGAQVVLAFDCPDGSGQQYSR